MVPVRIASPEDFLEGKHWKTSSEGSAWEREIYGYSMGFKIVFPMKITKTSTGWRFSASFRREGDYPNEVRDFYEGEDAEFHTGFFTLLSIVKKMAKNFKIPFSDEEYNQEDTKKAIRKPRMRKI